MLGPFHPHDCFALFLRAGPKISARSPKDPRGGGGRARFAAPPAASPVPPPSEIAPPASRRICGVRLHFSSLPTKHPRRSRAGGAGGDSPDTAAAPPALPQAPEAPPGKAKRVPGAFQSNKSVPKSQEGPRDPPRGRDLLAAAASSPAGAAGKEQERKSLFFLGGGGPAVGSPRIRRQHPALTPAPQPESFRLPPCNPLGPRLLKRKIRCQNGPWGGTGDTPPSGLTPPKSGETPPEWLQGSSKQFPSKRDPGEPPEEGRGGVEPPPEQPGELCCGRGGAEILWGSRGGGSSSSSPGIWAPRELLQPAPSRSAPR